jgi:hypothetical protein
MDMDALFHLMGVLFHARWAGAPSQEELTMAYYTQELRDAVQQLPEDEGGLPRILSEIIEDLETA